MLRKLLHKLLKPRHPWRQIGFSELSELYIVAMLRNFSLSMVGIFVPIYILQLGYPLSDVMLFYTIFYSSGVLGINELTGRLIARFGPKHIMRISFVVHIVFLIMMATLSIYYWPIIFLAVTFRISSVFYYLSHHVDFSKVKHHDHGGKELSYLNILERIGGVTGPLAGGVLATFFGGQVIMFVAAGMLMCSMIPLMLTGEPVKTHQKFRYRDLNFKKAKRALFISAVINTENSIALWMWPAYMSAFIFVSQPYIKLGIVTAIGLSVSILAALVVGRLVDNKKGYELIKVGSIANSLIHVSRLFVTNITGVIFVNTMHDSASVASRMAYFKGFYDSTDDFPGYRIAYLTLSENAMDLMRSIVWAGLTIAVLVFSNNQQTVLKIGFLIAALCSLLVLFQRFKALEKQ